MKSIVEEASSICKAIEQAWKRAGQPVDFSIRIHELPQRNIFGFTSKPAKIAFIYQEENRKDKNIRTASHTSSTGPIPSSGKPVVISGKRSVSAIKPEQKQKKIVQRPLRSERTAERSEEEYAGRAERIPSEEPWTPEMIDYVEKNMQELLQKLNITGVQVQAQARRYHLTLRFSKPLFEQEEKNKTFLRSSAHLILQSARNAFKRPLKGFKIILTTD